MSDQPARPIVNIDDLLASPDHVATIDPRGPFAVRLGKIGEALGSTGIGINVTVVPPGRKAFPRHYHYVNDEMFVVLSGRGTLHFGEVDHPIGPGDVIHIKAGTGIAFQLDNTGAEELRYLGLSTMIPADVFYYPDSDKHGIMANGVPFNALPSDGLGRFAKWVEADHGVGYYHNDPEAGGGTKD